MADNPLNRVRKAHKQQSKPEPTDTPAPQNNPGDRAAERAKPGRKPTGKRSDPNWAMRSFFIRKETDTKVKQAILELELAGVEYDKSLLMEDLLDAWLRWRDGEDFDKIMRTKTPKK